MFIRETRRASVLLVFFVVVFGLACSAKKGPDMSWGYTPTASVAQAPDLTTKIDFLEERLKSRPRAFLEMAELADLYLQRSRLRRTPDDLERSLNWVEASLTEVENPQALLVKADHLQMGHEFKKSLVIIDKVLVQDPGNLKAAVLGTRINLSQGDASGASSRLQDLPETPFSSLSFLRAQVAEANGQNDEARKLYRLSIRNEADGGSKSESARRRAVLARFEIKHGDLEQAHQLLEAAHAIAVEQPLTEVLRAKLLAHRGEYLKAGDLLRSGFEHYRDPTFLVRLGEIEHAASKPEAAQATFKTAAQLLKKDPLGHERDLALCLHFADAESHADEIRELMTRELERRQDEETLRIKDIVLAD